MFCVIEDPVLKEGNIATDKTHLFGRMEYSCIEDTIKNLQNSIKSDERKLYQLHLFGKSKFRNFIESKNNKIVYINKNDEVDVYTFNESIDTTCLDIVDLNEINKTLETYKQSILLLEARNYYNHYRKINSLMEII